MKRTFVENLPVNTHLRRVAVALPVALVVLLAVGGFFSKPTPKVVKEHIAQESPTEASSHPVVLRPGDKIDIKSKNYLRQARQALDKYRLTTPDANNAWYYYRRVLEKDPNNTEALAGTRQIANTYADLAVNALDQLHYRKARGYIERGLMVDPDNERLSKLKDTSGVSYTTTRTLDRVKSLFR